jgi:hypothetical protein
MIRKPILTAAVVAVSALAAAAPSAAAVKRHAQHPVASPFRTAFWRTW